MIYLRYATANVLKSANATYDSPQIKGGVYGALMRRWKTLLLATS